MVDYGRNLVGNIKVKTRSSGGDFVDIGKTKSDIDKNIHEMEKLVGEIKANPRYSSDSGKMINDLKEDIRKLKLIKYDNQGKPTEESLLGIYGKDVKNAKEINMTKNQYMDFLTCLSSLRDLEKSVKDKNSHMYIAKRAKIRDEYKRKLPMIDSRILGEPYDTYHELMSLKPFIRITRTKTGNVSIKSMLEGGRTIEIGESKDQIKIYINNLKKDKDRNVSLKNKYLTSIEDGTSDLKKLKSFDGKPIELSPSNQGVKIKDDKSVGIWLKNVEYKLDKDKKELKRLDDYIFNLDHDIKAMEDALKKINTGNKNVVTLKSIPKRIDLDKKSDLEKAIKDITDLSKDYEYGIKVNSNDKYMRNKFVGLLKEANDEVKELKKVLAKLV